MSPLLRKDLLQLSSCIRVIFIHLVAGNVNMINLGEIVLEDAAFDPHPLLRLEAGLLLHHSEHVGHLLDGNHLLLVDSHPQVGDALDGSLNTTLL